MERNSVCSVFPVFQKKLAKVELIILRSTGVKEWHFVPLVFPRLTAIDTKATPKLPDSSEKHHQCPGENFPIAQIVTLYELLRKIRSNWAWQDGLKGQ